MAFDSNMNYSVKQPTITIYVNDWNSNNQLSVPIIYASLNSWYFNTNLTLPTVTFNIDTTGDFNIDYVLPTITTTFNVSASINAQLDSIVRLPQMVFSTSVDNVYNLTKTIMNPSFFSSFSSVYPFALTAQIKKPIITYSVDFTTLNTKQTWVLNTITDAHSRYTNYDFNSYFKIGDKNFGIKDDGIYEITGDFDITIDGFLVQTNTVISAEVALPLTNFDEQSLKMCSDAIVYGRVSGDLEIVVTTDEQYRVEGLYVYDDDRVGMHRRRVKIPKGLKGNAWQYTIKNVDGSDFGINAFEVMTKTMQRLTW